MCIRDRTMPKGMGMDYSGMSYQEHKAQESIPPWVVYAISILLCFLILAAQYESWSLPFGVLLSTPVAIFGAYLALTLRGLENDVYAQIGLVMLIGLSAKNAILIVEFAKDEYTKGETIFKSAMGAARLRFRPILMTALDVYKRQPSTHPVRSAASPYPAARSLPIPSARRAGWSLRSSSATSSCAPMPTALHCTSRTWRASNSARRPTT